MEETTTEAARTGFSCESETKESGDAQEQQEKGTVSGGVRGETERDRVDVQR